MGTITTLLVEKLSESPYIIHILTGILFAVFFVKVIFPYLHKSKLELLFLKKHQKSWGLFIHETTKVIGILFASIISGFYLKQYSWVMTVDLVLFIVSMFIMILLSLWSKVSSKDLRNPISEKGKSVVGILIVCHLISSFVFFGLLFAIVLEEAEAWKDIINILFFFLLFSFAILTVYKELIFPSYGVIKKEYHYILKTDNDGEKYILYSLDNNRVVLGDSPKELSCKEIIILDTSRLENPSLIIRVEVVKSNL